MARILPTENTSTTTNMIKVLTVLPGTHAQPPIPNLNTYPFSSTSTSGPIITELSDERTSSSDGNEITENNSDATQMNETNSNFINNSKSSTRLTRQFSFGSKSTDSPSLPKRNQPTTVSAPSTLTKKLEQDDKKEIYV